MTSSFEGGPERGAPGKNRNGLWLKLGGAAALLAGIGLIAWFALGQGGSDTPAAGPSPVSGSQLSKLLGSTATPTLAPKTPIPPPLGDPPYTMIIDKLGVDATVKEYGLDANALPEVPVGPDAGKIVAWYNFSAKPGTGSNAVFAGHVTWNGEAVFFNLATLKAGDTIKVRGQNGAELVYQVSETFSVNPQDPSAVHVMDGTDKDQMTIITCTGTFFRNGNPVFGGDYTQRLVVRAALVGSTPASAAQALSGGQ